MPSAQPGRRTEQPPAQLRLVRYLDHMESVSGDLLRLCGAGDEATVRDLIRQGADIHVTDSDGDGVLRYAIGPRNLSLFEFLLDSGAPAGTASTDLAGETGYSIIHAVAAAGWAGALRLLLSHGANPNARALNGERPLMAAAACGSVTCVEMLEAAGAGLDSTDGEGDTALYYAASKGQLSVVIALCELGAAVDVLPNVFGHTALSVAASMCSYGSTAPREEQADFLRIARYLARNGASALPMYGRGYAFGRAIDDGRQVVPLYDFARAVQAYEDLYVVWIDRRAGGLDWVFLAERPIR